jgi:predicted alpha/beta hydrolase
VEVMADNREQLGEILIAIKEMELARLAQTALRKGSLLVRLEKLEEDRLHVQRTAMDAVTVPPSSVLSSDEKWFRWVDNEKQKMGQELARLAALEEEQRLRSATALGKVNAFEKMIEKLQSQRPKRRK